MFDYSISFRVTYQAECLVSALASCISVALVLQMYLSNQRAATANKPGLRRQRSAFVIQPLYEPILWLGLLVFAVRTLLLVVPGPYPTPPSWFSGAVESVGVTAPDKSALQHVQASRWVLDSSFYFLYWFSFSLINEGVSLFFCFSSPSAKAVAFSLKWALLLAALLATVTTVAFSHEQLDWPPAVHQTLDALFLVLPCTLHCFVLLRPADAAASAGSTRWAPLLFAAFNLQWRLLSAAAIQAGVYQTVVGSVLKAIRALGLPLAVYGCLAMDTQHWHSVLRAVMHTRQVVAVYETHKRHRDSTLQQVAEQQPLLQLEPPPVDTSTPPPRQLRSQAGPGTSPSQAFAANLLQKLDSSLAASPLHRRPRVASVGDSLPPPLVGATPPLLRTSSAGDVLGTSSRHSARRRRAGTASYSLMFLEPQAPEQPEHTAAHDGFALQMEHGAAPSAPSYGTGGGAAAPLLTGAAPRAHRSTSHDSVSWEALRPQAAATGAGTSSSPALRPADPPSSPTRGGLRTPAARSGIISPHELFVGKEVLGRGASSTVYKGRWQGRAVAVKRAVPDSLDAHTLAGFHEETMLLAALQHKRITRFYGMCVRPPGVELVFRLAPGGSLWDSLGKLGAGGSSRQHRLLLCLDAAEAVVHLHSLQPAAIVHRDIKSPNFLLQEGGRLMLGDFGQAAPLPRSGSFPPVLDEQAVGTHGWAAPELLRGLRYGPPVDVYALGIVLWEIWTGKRPFEDVPAAAMLFRVAVEGLRPPLPPSMPKGLCSLLRRCWSSSPEARPTAEQVQAQLRSVLQGLSPGPAGGKRGGGAALDVHKCQMNEFNARTAATRHLVGGHVQVGLRDTPPGHATWLVVMYKSACENSNRARATSR